MTSSPSLQHPTVWSRRYDVGSSLSGTKMSVFVFVSAPRPSRLPESHYTSGDRDGVGSGEDEGKMSQSIQ